MKKTISTLIVCALAAANCAPQESAHALPAARTCQKLRGTYVTAFKLMSAADDPALCGNLSVGTVARGEIIFDNDNNMHQVGYRCAPTAYTADNCGARTDCTTTGEAWSMRSVIDVAASADGAEFSGTAEIDGAGFVCSRMVGTITGIR